MQTPVKSRERAAEISSPCNASDTRLRLHPLSTALQSATQLVPHVQTAKAWKQPHNLRLGKQRVHAPSGATTTHHLPKHQDGRAEIKTPHVPTPSALHKYWILFDTMLSRSVLVVIAALSTFGVNLVDAAECTDAEWQTSQSIWSWAATTSACAQYAAGDNFVSAPCSATSCVGVMEQVGEQLPDCTASGVNNKVEVLNATTVCNNNALI